ncbi:MAG TPA: flavoprotein [Actinophytocola sp.]|uniref:flavoprotein n=1 Tax=Actinophytocola sp. TaxID=1872138 RepID=UPI002DBDCAE8|nr:flavoprotein [Actinophytocola sp.]HEU5472414.1 flavoprotein [Actinophytocola sp.]
MTASQPKRVLYLVVCAAPPAQAISELVELLHEQGCAVCVIATPRATTWIDDSALAEQTGYPVRHDYKRPDDPDVLPPADAIAVVPATFNTINKWVAGISDTFALGLLNEAIGLELPIVVAPYAKPPLAAHPVFERNLRTLSDWGVTVLPNEAIRPQRIELPFNWQPISELF